MASKHVVRLGPLKIGGGNPVMVQSMTNTDTRDVEATLGQIGRLVERGCEAVRVAVPDDRAADVLRELHDKSPVPLIADIHFDWRLAVRAIEAGFEGLRINPGNIGDESRVERVVRAAKANGAAIRVGVNSGSVEKELLERYGGPVPRAMAESAVNHVRMVEKYGLDQIVVSVKSSSVLDTVACYRELARLVPYPLHLGVTEAGSLMRGTVKSAAGLGILLFEGIGDTIRVSLTADPVEGNRRCLGASALPGLALLWSRDYFLSHLRAHGNRPHRHGKGREREAQRLQGQHTRGRHGLRCERPRRSQGSRHRPCRRA